MLVALLVTLFVLILIADLALNRLWTSTSSKAR